MFSDSFLRSNTPIRLTSHRNLEPKNKVTGLVYKKGYAVLIQNLPYSRAPEDLLVLQGVIQRG